MLPPVYPNVRALVLGTPDLCSLDIRAAGGGMHGRPSFAQFCAGIKKLIDDNEHVEDPCGLNTFADADRIRAELKDARAMRALFNEWLGLTCKQPGRLRAERVLRSPVILRPFEEARLIARLAS